MKLSVLLLLFLLLTPVTSQAFDLVIQKGDFSVVPEAPASDPFNYEIIGPREAVSTAKYSMKVAVTMPTGTSGAATFTAGTKPTNTKFVPCDNASTSDAVTLTLTYNAVGTLGTVDADVYVLFYNAHDPATKFYMLSRGAFPSFNVTVTARAAVTNIVPATDIYLTAANSPVTTVTETLFGVYVSIVGAPAGTWQVVGIVAPNATVNFDDPSTWKAWDVATFMVRKPWLGVANPTCI